jgi:N-acetylglucosamine kinase-like BadF-type ATPase
VSGTGSIAIARGPDGSLSRVGGWGAAFGDPGSGYAIGMGALRAAIRVADGLDPRPALFDAVTATLGLADIRDLRHHPPGVTEVAALVPAVARAARGGDAMAGALLDLAGRELADAVLAAARNAGLVGPGLCLALGGGVLVHVARVRRSLLGELEHRGAAPASVVPVRQPVAAAADLAVALLLGTSGEA